MGKTGEDIDSKEKLKENRLNRENRVFVCIGTDKKTKEITSWVMIFSEELDYVIIYDTKYYQEWVLYGRLVSDLVSNTYRIDQKKKNEEKDKNYL